MLRLSLPTRTLLPLSRSFSSLPPRFSSFSRPSPLPLPRAQQQEFEELLRKVQNPARASAVNLSDPDANVQPEELSMHPDYRPKPKPRWEGKVNPETGEVNGPKAEPLAHGEQSFISWRV